MTRSEQTLESTRRSFLCGAAVSITSTTRARGGTDEVDVFHIDPVVSAWRDWLTAHKLFGEICREGQRLETQMLRTFGSFPRVKIALDDEASFVWVYTAEEIDRLLPNADNWRIRRTAHDELSARQAEWNSADMHIGYSEAKKAEVKVAEVEDRLADVLWRAAPRSFAGVAAKLHCVLETEDPGSGLKEAPWPQLRAILADLVHIATDAEDTG